MKVLGIDYGTKRIGLAISDETQTLARELSILSPNEFWQNLKDLIAEHAIEKIVIGLPIGMSGQGTDKTAEVQEFRDKLQLRMPNIELEFVDERLTSALAAEIAGDDRNIDSLAAQLILQTYLDAQSSSS